MSLADKIIRTIHVSENDVFVLGIDGPTAAGKTWLADQLAEKIGAMGVGVFVYRLDWTLLPRKQREKDLELLKKSGGLCEYEAWEQMDIGRAEKFLEIVSSFRKGKESKKTIRLTGLYNREAGGKCDLNKTCILRKGMVVIVEGHYTHLPQLHWHIDRNILLLAGQQVLLKRKISRAGHYRNQDDLALYFYRTDLPSFSYYLSRYAPTFETICDNTDFSAPSIKKPSYLHSWVKLSRDMIPVQKSAAFPLSVLSFNQHKDPYLKKNVVLALKTVIDFDKKAGKLLGLHYHTWKSSFSTVLLELLKQNSFAKNTLFCEDFSAFYKNSGTYSYALHICKSPEIYLFVQGNESSVSVAFLFRRGLRIFTAERVLRNISDEDFSEKNFIESAFTSQKNLLVPNRFFIPPLFHPDSVDTIRFTSSMSPVQVLTETLQSPSFLVHRCGTERELGLFARILRQQGYKTYTTGGLLVSTSLKESGIMDSFLRIEKIFGGKAGKQISDRHFRAANAKNMKWQAEAITLLRGSSFSFRDGVIAENRVDISIPEVRKLLRHRNPLLNGAFTNWLLRFMPDAEVQKNIPLKTWLRMFPTSFANLYSALRISGGAVIFSNIYDVRDSSFDIISNLLTASSLHKPIGLQVSQNAVGEKEEFIDAGGDRKISEGYLKRNGACEFADTIRKNLIKLASENSDFYVPLFGAGLDHAALEYDKPEGRTLRFLKNAARTGQFTSVCFDTSMLFSGEGNNTASPHHKTAEIMASWLLRSGFPAVFTDTEFTLGGLHRDKENGNVKRLSGDWISGHLIPVLKKKKLDAYAGNLLLAYFFSSSENSETHTCPSFLPGVITGVLHGTSNISPGDIKLALNRGYHKINFAGEFLHEMIGALPPVIRKNFGKKPEKAKYFFPLAEKDFLKMTEKEINTVVSALRLRLVRRMEECRVPSLSEQEEAYFTKRPYLFTQDDIRCIAETLLRELKIRKGKAAGIAEKTPGLFFASMIEVPYSEFSNGLAMKIFRDGCTCFHIDAGDGKYVERSFSGIDKILWLKKHIPNVRIHAHLMMQNPHLKRGKSVSQAVLYARAGASVIYIHPEAFQDEAQMGRCIEEVSRNGAECGLVAAFNSDIGNFTRLLTKFKIGHVLHLCVPPGRGGQAFRYESTDNIASLRKFSISNEHPLKIEVDGGMNERSIALCRSAGANYFSGWSILVSGGLQHTRSQLDKIKRLIR